MDNRKRTKLDVFKSICKDGNVSVGLWWYRDGVIEPLPLLEFMMWQEVTVPCDSFVENDSGQIVNCEKIEFHNIWMAAHDRCVDGFYLDVNGDGMTFAGKLNNKFLLEGGKHYLPTFDPGTIKIDFDCGF